MLHSKSILTQCEDYRFVVSIQPNLSRSGYLVVVTLIPPYMPSVLMASYRFDAGQTLEATLRAEECQKLIDRQIAKDPKCADKIYKTIKRRIF